MAQLVERLLPIAEVRGSNPVIGKNLYWTFYCQLCWKDKNKEKRPGKALLKKSHQLWGIAVRCKKRKLESLWFYSSRFPLYKCIKYKKATTARTFLGKGCASLLAVQPISSSLFIHSAYFHLICWIWAAISYSPLPSLSLPLSLSHTHPISLSQLHTLSLYFFSSHPTRSKFSSGYFHTSLLRTNSFPIALFLFHFSTFSFSLFTPLSFFLSLSLSVYPLPLYLSFGLFYSHSLGNFLARITQTQTYCELFPHSITHSLLSLYISLFSFLSNSYIQHHLSSSSGSFLYLTHTSSRQCVTVWAIYFAANNFFMPTYFTLKTRAVAPINSYPKFAKALPSNNLQNDTWWKKLIKNSLILV